MYVQDILCEISRGPFKTPHKIFHPLIERLSKAVVFAVDIVMSVLDWSVCSVIYRVVSWCRYEQ